MVDELVKIPNQVLIVSPALERIASEVDVLFPKNDVSLRRKERSRLRTKMQRSTFSEKARSVLFRKSILSFGEISIEKDIPTATLPVCGSSSQPIKAEKAVNCANSNRAVALSTIIDQRMVKDDVSCQNRLKRSGMIVSRCTIETKVLVDKSLFKVFNIFKKGLEAGGKLTQYMESSGRLCIENCNRLRKDLNKALVALKCVKKLV